MLLIIKIRLVTRVKDSSRHHLRAFENAWRPLGDPTQRFAWRICGDHRGSLLDPDGSCLGLSQPGRPSHSRGGSPGLPRPADLDLNGGRSPKLRPKTRRGWGSRKASYRTEVRARTFLTLPSFYTSLRQPAVSTPPSVPVRAPLSPVEGRGRCSRVRSTRRLGKRRSLVLGAGKRVGPTSPTGLEAKAKGSTIIAIQGFRLRAQTRVYGSCVGL